MHLRYLGRSSIVVGGPVTGWEYAFSESNPVQLVDMRDANKLIQTKSFQRERS